MMAYPGLKGTFLHSDRDTQYTSQQYRDAVAGAWTVPAAVAMIMFYNRYNAKKMLVEELKVLIGRYPPMIKRQEYYSSLKQMA